MSETNTNNTEFSEAVQTEKKNYRVYGTRAVDSETGKVRIEVAAVPGETEKGWEEYKPKAGTEHLASFDVVSYQVTSQAAFEQLVPDETQRLYLINKGMAQQQNGAVSKLGKMIDDETGELVNADQTIDLLDALRTPPEKTRLTDAQKIERQIAALIALGGLDEEGAAVMRSLLKKSAA